MLSGVLKTFPKRKEPSGILKKKNEPRLLYFEKKL